MGSCGSRASKLLVLVDSVGPCLGEPKLLSLSSSSKRFLGRASGGWVLAEGAPASGSLWLVSIVIALERFGDPKRLSVEDVDNGFKPLQGNDKFNEG